MPHAELLGRDVPWVVLTRRENKKQQAKVSPMKFSLSTLLAAAALAATAALAPASAGHRDCKAEMAYLNPDHDGTIDWREARRAAVRLFYKLDPDRDGTLDLNEVRGRVGILSFARFNPDRDGTLDKHEFLALVKHRFERANPDADGTIDCRELNSLAGRRLLRVLM
jgi:hypothetical protein